jgi:hypothetical protein
MAYKQISFRLLELFLFRDKAINIAMRSIGYKQQTALQKGFLEDLAVKAKRLAFAREAINWSQERVYN